jgi:hypothetical protein
MSEISIILRAVDEASNVVAKAGNNITNSMKSVEATSQQVTRAQQAHEASTKQLILGMNNLATSAFSLYDAFDRVQDMQVSVDRANLQVKSTLNSLEDAQRRYNATVEKYGAGSEQATAAAEDLEIAQERYNVAIERADMLQGNMNETIVRSALTIIPTTITMVDSLARIWNNFPDLSATFSKVSGSINGVGINASTAAIGVAAFVGSFIVADTIMKAVPENMRGIVGALMATIGAIVAATIAWMAFHGTMTVGIAVPIILAAVGAGVAGVKGLMGLAAGGVITQPTVALIGEAGPEAVIPLHSLEGAATQQITVNPTIHIGNISSDIDLERVTDSVTRGIAEALRRRL